MLRDDGQERPPVALQFDLSHAVDAQELRVVGRPEKAHFDQPRIAEYDVRRDAALLCQPFAQLSQALEQGEVVVGQVCGSHRRLRGRLFLDPRTGKFHGLLAPQHLQGRRGQLQYGVSGDVLHQIAPVYQLPRDRDPLRMGALLPDAVGRQPVVAERADALGDQIDGVVEDDTRIVAALPTLEWLSERVSVIAACSHLGKAKGKPDPTFSLAPVAPVLERLLGRPVVFVEDCLEADVKDRRPGTILLLENLRFHPGETRGDEEFARQLAALGDIYVDDAFSCAHRAHASVEAIAHLMPAYAGMAMMAEINALSAALEDPKRPVMAVVGGAKVSTKIEVLTNLDHLRELGILTEEEFSQKKFDLLGKL